MMRRLGEAVQACLDALEGEAVFGESVTIGDIAVAAFLQYLDFRWPDRDWRLTRPTLAHGSARFAERPSMIGTPYAVLP
jgi:glutathione S-transferase